MTFVHEMQKFADKTRRKRNELVEDVVGYVVGRIDKRSPVGNPKTWQANIARAGKNLPPLPAGYVGGRFRGNWQLGVGTVPAGVVARIDPDGFETVTAAIAEIPADAAGLVYTYVNNLPYARRLEEGHSAQSPPNGMVGLTVIDAHARVESTARAS